MIEQDVRRLCVIKTDYTEGVTTSVQSIYTAEDSHGAIWNLKILALSAILIQISPGSKPDETAGFCSTPRGTINKLACAASPEQTRTRSAWLKEHPRKDTVIYKSKRFC